MSMTSDSESAVQRETIVDAELVAEHVPPGDHATRRRLPTVLGDPLRSAVAVARFVGSVLEWVFGALSLMVALAILAVVPVLQLLSLGYLLECSGRIARTGRFTAGFVGVRKAARVGSVALGVWLVLWPLRFAAVMWQSARLIDPESSTTRGWGLFVGALSIAFGIHIAGACWRGGRLRHFLWPFVRPRRVMARLRRGHLYSEARDAVWDFTIGLRLPYYFSLGLRGFVGGFAWLVIPVTLIAVGRQVPVLAWLGVLLLIGVLMYLPFLQTRFAAENRLKAMFELRAVRRLFVRAPVAFWTALAVTVLFALPLYLLKIEMIPREAAWLPSIAFVVFIFPARLLVGWSYARAVRRDAPRFWLFRHTSRVAMLPVAALYVLVLFFTQYAAWHGVWSLYEQHAFLVPVPFLGM